MPLPRFRTINSRLLKACGILFVAATPLSLSVPAQTTLTRFHQVHSAMGTQFELDLYAPDQATATQIASEAFDEIDRIEALLSNYRESSELSRISREAASAAVTTDPETFDFLTRSFYWSRQSSGAFDITVGPLLRAWGFFFHNGRVPSQAELEALRTTVGWQKVHLDATSRTIRFAGGRRLELDPGSIGKGFAVDRVVSLLRGLGVTSAFLSAGGSTLYAIGTPTGEAGWPVDIPDPNHPGSKSTLLLKDESLSTGACTQKFFIRNGHRYCHIFNPHTMRPVERVLQTTVIDPSATDSDALSTVVFVATPAESRRILVNRPQTRVLIYSQNPSTPPCVAINWLSAPCRFSPVRSEKDHHP